MKSAHFPTGDEPALADEHGALVHRLNADDARVIASPARAARETAGWIAQAYDIDPAFGDLDYGRWRGRSVREIGERSPDDIRAWLTDPHALPHGGESLAMLAARVADGLDKLAREHAHARRCIIVTHAIVLKVALAHHERKPLASVFSMDFAPLSSIELRAPL